MHMWNRNMRVSTINACALAILGIAGSQRPACLGESKYMGAMWCKGARYENDEINDAKPASIKIKFVNRGNV